MSTQHPNIVFVVLDTARADAFEPWGAPEGSSPTVADLASEGSAAGRAVAPSCWTLPSHAAMFSGLLPRDVGLIRAPGGTPASCRATIENLGSTWLPTALRDEGYSTIGVSANAWISEPVGFATGFDEFHTVGAARIKVYHGGGWRSRVKWAHEAVRARLDDGAREATGIIDAAIGRVASPFFLFVNLIECHAPYLPPLPFNNLSIIGRFRAGEDHRRYLTFEAMLRSAITGLDVPAPAIDRFRRLYARSAAYADAWLATLLSRLEVSGLVDDTIVVVTSDHGENLGEQGMFGHSLSLDERLIHVPLVARGLDLEQPAPIGLHELPQRLFAAAGLDSARWTDPEPGPAGIAVSQWDRLLDEDDSRLDRLDAWDVTIDELRPGVLTDLTAATDGRWKLIADQSTERLFDLESDPGEISPLDPSEAGPALEALRAGVARGDRRVEPVVVAESDPMSDDLEARMRMLGYM